MSCPHCGCPMAGLVECHRQLDYGPDDELIQKQTTCFYRQCYHVPCRYVEITHIEVIETTLPYYAVFV